MQYSLPLSGYNLVRISHAHILMKTYRVVAWCNIVICNDIANDIMVTIKHAPQTQDMIVCSDKTYVRFCWLSFS